jgi:hypothetical protein
MKRKIHIDKRISKDDMIVDVLPINNKVKQPTWFIPFWKLIIEQSNSIVELKQNFKLLDVKVSKLDVKVSKIVELNNLKIE